MPRFEPFDWYEEPLCYDLIFDEGTEQEARFLRDVHARYGRTRGRRVLEPACGTGRLMAALAEVGWSSLGIDCEPGMIAFAKERLRRFGRQATVKLARMEAFETKQRFDLAHCLVSSFKHLPTEKQARDHLRCVAQTLKPGGVYVLGVHLSEYEETRRARERWIAQVDGGRVVCNIQSWPPDRKTRTERVRARMTVEDERGEVERRLETQWTFRTYSLAELERLLRSVPELEHVGTHDFTHDIERGIELDGDQLDVVLILRR